VSGGSHAAGKPKDRGRIQSSPRRGPVPIIPGTPDEVVSEIASRLPLVMSGRVQRETVPADESAYPSTTGLVVHHELKVEAFEGGRIGRALWEGSLLASAVADEFAARGFEEVIGAWGILVTADGRRRRVGGAVNRFGFAISFSTRSPRILRTRSRRARSSVGCATCMSRPFAVSRTPWSSKRRPTRRARPLRSSPRRGYSTTSSTGRERDSKARFSALSTPAVSPSSRLPARREVSAVGFGCARVSESIRVALCGGVRPGRSDELLGGTFVNARAPIGSMARIWPRFAQK
jgi:hypothetical protein